MRAPRQISETSPVIRWLLGGVFAIGGFISLGLAFGVLYSATPCSRRGCSLIFWFQDSSRRVEDLGTYLLPGSPIGKWQIVFFGIAFFCAAMMLVWTYRHERVQRYVSAVLLVTFITPIAWIAYFSGKVGWDFKVMATFGIICALVPLIFNKRFRDRGERTP
jgi:hypothetical protein